PGPFRTPLRLSRRDRRWRRESVANCQLPAVGGLSWPAVAPNLSHLPVPMPPQASALTALSQAPRIVRDRSSHAPPVKHALSSEPGYQVSDWQESGNQKADPSLLRPDRRKGSRPALVDGLQPEGNSVFLQLLVILLPDLGILLVVSDFRRVSECVITPRRP